MTMPFLRFKQQDGNNYPDWNKSCIKFIGHCIAGATPSTKHNDYWDNGSIPWLSSGEVNKGQIFDTDKKITQLGYDNCSTKMVKANSVIIAMAGQGKTRGMVGITRIPLCTNQSLCSIELFDNVLSDYLYQYLKTRYIDLRNLSSGNDARGGLNLEIIRNFEVKYPCPEEQQKIADFFSDIDTQIENYKQSLDNLEAQKKQLLRQVFSQELRFTKDDGSNYPDWEEEYLGNCCDITTGKLNANAMVENGKYDFYTSGIKKYNIDNYAFEGPAITIAGNGATVGYLHLADGKFNAYQRTYVLTNFKHIRKYLYYIIGQELPKKINKEVRTGIIPYIVLNMLTKLTIYLPNKEEQQKIADFFSDFDERIELERKRLQTMQEIKKGLLQQMFC